MITNELSEIERENQITLPAIYKEFYALCAKQIPRNLVGTDLRNSSPDLNDSALELLEEDGVEDFLEADDFVFLMHQGYIFWYFKADGNPDPTVFGYHESHKAPKLISSLSTFIKSYK